MVVLSLCHRIWDEGSHWANYDSASIPSAMLWARLRWPLDSQLITLLQSELDGRLWLHIRGIDR